MVNSMRNQWEWFESWLAENFSEVLNDLNDGCNLEQLLKAENETGLKLPQSFKDFYLIHNGQKDGDHFGLFYGVSLLPLSKIIKEWRDWKEVAEEISYEEREGNVSILNDGQVSLMLDKVKAQYANKKWIPFAVISDNCYLGLDFDPEINGTVGQIINIGREEEQKAVLANSFEEFVNWYIREIERGNYLIYSGYGNKQFIPKEYKERFFRGYNYFLGPVATRFIGLEDEAKLKEVLENL